MSWAFLFPQPTPGLLGPRKEALRNVLCLDYYQLPPSPRPPWSPKGSTEECPRLYQPLSSCPSCTGILSPEMACCRCNKDGVCRSCSCVKDNKPCKGCQPGRLGKCENGFYSSSSSLPQKEKSKTAKAAPHTKASIVQPLPVQSQVPPTQSNMTLTPPTLSPDLFQATPVSHNISVASPHTSPGPLLTLVSDLPPFKPTTTTNIVWGTENLSDFGSVINQVYNEVIHWRKNFFRV